MKIGLRYVGETLGCDEYVDIETKEPFEINLIPLRKHGLVGSVKTLGTEYYLGEFEGYPLELAIKMRDRLFEIVATQTPIE